MPDLHPTRRAVLGAALALPLTAAAPKGHAMPLPIVELRRYRTHPGKRDELIALFERQFVEPQEAVGMSIVGTFREPADPDRFTWIRGFTDMAARERGLNQFYSGPVWQAHRAEANAALDDNDDVLLLRESGPGSGFAPSRSARPPAAAAPAGHSQVIAIVCYPVDPAAFAADFEARARPALAAKGVRVLATFVRERSPNNFPRLPVREGEEVFVWFAGCGDCATVDWARRRAGEAGVLRPCDVIILEATARSRLRG